MALNFFRMGRADPACEAGAGRAALGVVAPSLGQAEVAVGGPAYFGGVCGARIAVLAVIFPPADGAKFHGRGVGQGARAAAGAAEAQGVEM